MRDVRLHGGLGQEQLLRDLGVGSTGSDLDEDFAVELSMGSW
jgi:hypothetical protein